MLTIFGKIGITELQSFFNDEDKCLSFLAQQKWEHGFVCKKCGHTHYCAGKTPYSRRCTKCKKDESATANTIFHRCRIYLPDAFKIAHLVCSEPKISSTKLSTTLDLRQMTCWKFKKKVTECIDQRNDVSDTSKVQLKEVILGAENVK